jgi:hypothetical protein
MTMLDERLNPGAAQSAVARTEALDWEWIRRDLDEQGSAMLSGILSGEECRALAGLYPEDGLFRSRVIMARHGFGRGEYKYFSYPLPDIIQGLRTTLYRGLAPVASFVPLPCFCSMAKAITTAFTRIFMESTSFPSRWPSFSPNRKGTSPAANLCSRNSVRGCNRDLRLYPYARVME